MDDIMLPPGRRAYVNLNQVMDISGKSYIYTRNILQHDVVTHKYLRKNLQQMGRNRLEPQECQQER